MALMLQLGEDDMMQGDVMRLVMLIMTVKVKKWPTHQM
jgi:hypothetical protein